MLRLNAVDELALIFTYYYFKKSFTLKKIVATKKIPDGEVCSELS